MHQIQFQQPHCGAYSTSADRLAGFKEPGEGRASQEKGYGRKGRKGERPQPHFSSPPAVCWAWLLMSQSFTINSAQLFALTLFSVGCEYTSMKFIPADVLT